MNDKFVEQRTIKLFLTATAFVGLISSVGNIQDIVAKKALLAADWQVTLLTMLSPIVSLFSIWWGKILEQSKNKSFFFLLILFMGRLPLVLGFFITGIYQYIGLLALMFFFNSLWTPAQNSLLHENINIKIRGKIFGFSTSISTFVGMVGSFLAGIMMDINDNCFRYIFLILGIGGSFAPLLLYFVPRKEYGEVIEKIELKKIIVSPLKRAFELLKKDKSFARYEINFMIYGIGFMIMLPVVPKFLVENLDMTYTEMFLAKGVISQLGILIFAPLAGKFYDKKHPNLFVSYVFGFLSLWPLFFLFSSITSNLFYAKILIFFSYIFFGIAMSGVVIAWNLGSISFAKNKDVSMYQSVHVSLTGIRGLVVPLFGLFCIKFFAIKIIFFISIMAFIVASFFSYRTYILENNNKR